MDAMRDSGLDDFAQNVLSDAEESAYDIIRLSTEANPATAQRVESVRDDVRNKWTCAWELFDACVFAGQQNGAILLRRSGRAKDEYAPVRDALILIHCAGVLTMQEIGALCKAGLWAGGAARWRALHELAVTATVIAHRSGRVRTRTPQVAGLPGFVPLQRLIRACTPLVGRLRKPERSSDEVIGAARRPFRSPWPDGVCRPG